MQVDVPYHSPTRQRFSKNLVVYLTALSDSPFIWDIMPCFCFYTMVAKLHDTSNESVHPASDIQPPLNKQTADT